MTEKVDSSDLEQSDELSFDVESFDVSDASASERQSWVWSPYAAES
jgi:hypothetical protein